MARAQKNLSIPGVINDLGKAAQVGGDILSGANKVASGQGVSGAPEQAAIAGGAAIANPTQNAWSLVFGNTTGLLTRILKVGIGAFLLLAGIMKMTNADKDLVKIAGTAAKGAVMA